MGFLHWGEPSDKVIFIFLDPWVFGNINFKYLRQCFFKFTYLHKNKNNDVTLSES